MAVGIIQLVAKSKIDTYLTSDPQITFFKIVYRRHTNFATDSVVQKFTSDADFGKTVVCDLSKIGDLVSEMVLYVKLPEIPSSTNPYINYAWAPNIGYRLIEYVSVEIGNQQIDKQYGEWLYIWSHLVKDDLEGTNKLVGNVSDMYKFTKTKPAYNLYIPLNFWFCRSTGLALPLVALRTVDVKIILKIRKLTECLVVGPTNSIQIIENVCPFNKGEYIQQKTSHDSNTTYAQFIDWDPYTNRMYYIKLSNSSNSKFSSTQAIPSQNNFMDTMANIFAPYHIKNIINGNYVTPVSNGREQIENTSTYYKKINIIDCWLYANYIYLDKDERMKFVSMKSQYLVEQIVLTPDYNVISTSMDKKIVAENPIKSVYWTLQLNSATVPGHNIDAFNYTDSLLYYPSDYPQEKIPQNVPNYWSDSIADNNYRLSNQPKFYGNGLVLDANILIDGVEKFGKMSGTYFNKVQPYQHNMSSIDPGIYLYGFCMYNFEYQPSGSFNSSMVNSVTLSMKLGSAINSTNPAVLKIYTTTYNILNIWNNTALLLFANVVN